MWTQGPLASSVAGPLAGKWTGTSPSRRGGSRKQTEAQSGLRSSDESARLVPAVTSLSHLSPGQAVPLCAHNRFLSVLLQVLRVPLSFANE